MNETEMEIELIDLGFGELVRSSNEEFRTVEWEEVGVTPEPNEKPSCLDVRQRQTRNPLNEFK